MPYSGKLIILIIKITKMLIGLDILQVEQLIKDK